MFTKGFQSSFRRDSVRLAAWLVTILLVISNTAKADETCMSPYMAKIVGQEDFDSTAG